MKSTRILRQQELAAAKSHSTSPSASLRGTSGQAQLPSKRKPLTEEAQAARERYLAKKALLVPASVLAKYESK